MDIHKNINLFKYAEQAQQILSKEGICDVRGGYCRIKDRTNNTSHNYLDINGNVVSNNKTLPNGKQTGRPKAEYNAMTHFRILKREEM